MVDPSLTVSIDRTSLALPALVFSAAAGASDLGLTGYQEPAMQPRIDYAPASRITHGEVSLGWAWQQTLLNFSFTTIVATEAESRTLIAAVRSAITQVPTYSVTVTVSGAPAETWRCDPGSLTPDAARSLVDMKQVRPVWSVSIPCYPVRTVA